MAQADSDVCDHKVDDFDAITVDDHPQEILQARARVSIDTESDEAENEVTNVSDTTAAEARRGKDIQGIPWSSLPISREKYREQRLLQYKNYENLNR